MSPEHEIEAGGAFGIFYFLVAPYLLASLWVVPSGLTSLLRPAATWALTVTLTNSLLTCGFAVWMLVGGFEPLHRILPGLRTYALAAALTSALTFLLALASVTPHVTEDPRPPR
ncbi:hypothetical protein [Nocardioides daphniae]|uniref:Uncharacterized protein n=1 Tax=Nocardioides daphniae TaxID=402297 RepID=A0A4P7U8U3_9ACTN|nr:hypothetical protein [Nocardioides daphniae]QCC76593.1 hypothetical protein E2C04_04060 [Nocardioides daphniae]